MAQWEFLSLWRGPLHVKRSALKDAEIKEQQTLRQELRGMAVSPDGEGFGGGGPGGGRGGGRGRGRSQSCRRSSCRPAADALLISCRDECF